MFRLFQSGSEEKTRFESAPELKNVYYYLQQLRTQRDALLKCINTETHDGRVARDKYEILNSLIKEFDDHVSAFNAQGDKKRSPEEQRVLLLQLFKILQGRPTTDIEILAKRRNRTSETVITSGVIVGGSVAALGASAAPIALFGYAASLLSPNAIVFGCLAGWPFGVIAGDATMKLVNAVVQDLPQEFNTRSGKLMQDLVNSMAVAYNILAKDVSLEDLQNEAKQVFGDDEGYSCTKLEWKRLPSRGN